MILGKLTAIIEKDDDGYFAYCPELKGCHTQGDTLEEAYNNLKEAVDLYLETLNESEKSSILCKEVFSKIIEVEVA